VQQVYHKYNFLFNITYLNILSVPCRPGTPAYRLESKTRKTYCHMPNNTGSFSLLGSALALLCVSRLWILPPCTGGLQHCHVSRGSRSCLPTQEGSGTVMCPTTLAPASLLRRAPVLAHVPQLSVGRKPQE
jgi:hypothetical protein